MPGFERLPGRQQCLIALAGVPVSAASAWLCLRFAPQTEFFRLFYRFSLGMALVNVLPVWPLDGARVLLCAARWFGREEPARRAMLWLSYLLAAGMLALGLAGVFQGRVNLSLFLLPPYLAYAAWQSSMGGSLRGAAAALEGESWPKGKLLRALPFVCRGTPEKLELLRLLRALPEGRTALLYKFDAANRQADGSACRTEDRRIADPAGQRMKSAGACPNPAISTRIGWTKRAFLWYNLNDYESVTNGGTIHAKAHGTAKDRRPSFGSLSADGRFSWPMQRTWR